MYVILFYSSFCLLYEIEKINFKSQRISNFREKFGNIPLHRHFLTEWTFLVHWMNTLLLSESFSMNNNIKYVNKVKNNLFHTNNSLCFFFCPSVNTHYTRLDLTGALEISVSDHLVTCIPQFSSNLFSMYVIFVPCSLLWQSFFLSIFRRFHGFERGTYTFWRLAY